MLPILKKQTQEKNDGDTHARLKCFSVFYKFKIIWVLTLHLKRLMHHVWLMYISSPTLYCAEVKISDTDEDVKDSLNGVSTELMEEKERRRGGFGQRDWESERREMEKEEKITNVIWPAAAVIISHSS